MKNPRLTVGRPFPARLGLSPVVAEPKSPPDIVTFVAEDRSQLDSEADSSAEMRTPPPAKLATRGLKFTSTFKVSPSFSVITPRNGS